MEETAIPPLLGVIGHPIAGNPMQFAMEQAIAAAQLDWRFLSFDVSPERLAGAVAGVDALGFRGLAVAPPHSAAILGLVPQQSETARVSGWADAISRGSDGTLVADNLIGDSLVSLLERVPVAGAAVALLGSTPESQSLFAALVTLAPKTLLVRDIPPDHLAQALQQRQSTGFPAVTQLDTGDESVLAEIQVLVRGELGSSTAAEAKALEMQIGRLRDDCVVVDLAVCASTSPLLRTAGERGLATISAIDLLVARTAMAFRRWTGREADRTTLQEAFEEYLEI